MSFDSNRDSIVGDDGELNVPDTETGTQVAIQAIMGGASSLSWVPLILVFFIFGIFLGAQLTHSNSAPPNFRVTVTAAYELGQTRGRTNPQMTVTPRPPAHQASTPLATVIPSATQAPPPISTLMLTETSPLPSSMAYLRQLFYQSRITSVSWEPGRRQIETGDAGGTTTARDVDTGQAVYHWDSFIDEVLDASWSPDGTRIAILNRSGDVHIRNVSTSEVVLTIENRPFTDQVAWSPDSRFLALCEDPNVVILDAQTGSQVRAIESHLPYLAAAWSPDGSRFAAAHEDSVEVYDTLFWEVIKELHYDDSVVQSVAWSAGGTRLATLNDDGILGIWSALEGTSQWTLATDMHAGERMQVRWSPNNHLVAVYAQNGSHCGTAVEVWSARTWHIKYRIPHLRCQITDAEWNSDGSLFAIAGDGLLSIWNIPTL